MASGIAVNEACREIYNDVKMTQKGRKKMCYAVLKISDDLKEIVLDEERPAREACEEDKKTEHCPSRFMDLVRTLPEDDGRYIVYDYAYESSFGTSSKIILVLWCPNNITIKKKMLYASSKDALKKVFADCGGEFQADCVDDLCDADITKKLKKV